ncbi:hypothetical protein NMK71_01580 [Weeksellaceae bacterium KMM 9713]|uniref:tRNA-specific 2-thiouridylase MnmA-like central domain-containing protein n=1 Tax=Profundicola chukchiensis TaxID=2961959 RepID=A0A9X4MYF0_9FLAO|nr:tRNA methyl transferase PRC-barrel domain-containing protein [Profundicola chukchiensis]MDG4945092.1 hypothetical protein [Profundicola chukchiensis]
MSKAGQIVEIPSEASIYSRFENHFHSLKAELDFLAEALPYNLFDGFLIGEHYGLDDFVIGQRKGINVGGKDKPIYVIGKNQEYNQLFVGAGWEHPGLMRKVFRYAKSDFELNAEFCQDLKNLNDTEVQVVFYNKNDLKLAELFVLEDNVYLKFENTMHVLDLNQVKNIIKNDQEILKIKPNKNEN